MEHARTSTIEELVRLPAPPWGDRSPRTAAERIVYAVEGEITDIKLEEDSDYHIVFRGASGQTMVIEIPAPYCAEGSGMSGGQPCVGRAQQTLVLRWHRPGTQPPHRVEDGMSIAVRHGLTIAETAERLTCSQSQVKKLLRSGDLRRVQALVMGAKDLIQLASIETQERQRGYVPRTAPRESPV